MRHTPLYDAHLAAGGRIVDFAGWALPINYGSQIEEHRQVREDAGMFDVSHMTVVDIRGPRSRERSMDAPAMWADRVRETRRSSGGVDVLLNPPRVNARLPDLGSPGRNAPPGNNRQLVVDGMQLRLSLS